MIAPSQGRREPCFNAFLVITGLLWLTLIGMGFLALAREGYSPARENPAVPRFPAGSATPLSLTKPTLLLFVHPQCPCTRATLHELDRFLAETQGKAAVTIIFTIPAGVPRDWEQGYLWTFAHGLPGVHVVRDVGGIEARRFHVVGSGHALLYFPTGDLLFSGGITASRGDEGDNAGLSSVVSLVLTGRAAVHRTPVFGCSLL